MRTDVQAAFDVLKVAVTSGDPVVVADADVAFHRAVFVRCGHEMLLSQLETLQALSRRIVLTNQISSADAPTLIAQHAPIAEAVELRDPELLEAAVRTHVIEAGELLMTRMSALEPSRSRRPQSTSFGLGRWPSGASPHPRGSAAARTSHWRTHVSGRPADVRSGHQERTSGSLHRRVVLGLAVPRHRVVIAPGGEP